MRVRHFLSITFLLLAFSCEQLTDQRTRAEPPALPPVYVEPEPFVNLTPSKMDVVYIGMDNPLNLQSLGLDLRDITLIATPPGYIGQYQKEYTLRVSATGRQAVKVLYKGKLLNEFSFRTKRVPDPEATISGKSSGRMSSGEFKAQRGVLAMLPDFDFAFRCEVVGFTVSRFSPGKSKVSENNEGRSFTAQVQSLINNAAPGDVFTFTEVKAKCPKDEVARLLNPMVFEIF